MNVLQSSFTNNAIAHADCYAVPHTEQLEEQSVAINKDYHKSMLSARRKVNKREVIVGWYTTTTAEGQVIIDNSSLIHDFYTKEVAEPVHLVVDTTLAGEGGSMGLRAFVSAPMVAGPHVLANIFHEVRVQLELAEHEIVAVDHMGSKGQRQLGRTPWSGSTVLAAIPSAAEALTQSTDRILARIDLILAYVNGVVDGSIPAHADIGMALADTLGAAQGVRGEDFQAVFQAKSQDLLMVNYLVTLLQNQLAIAEKLNEII